MLNACATRFDVTENLKFFVIFLELNKVVFSFVFSKYSGSVFAVAFLLCYSLQLQPVRTCFVLFFFAK